MATAERDLARVTALTPGASEHAVTNVNYLKNVVINYMCSSDKQSQQALLPVLGQILQLNPEELKKVKAAAEPKGIYGLFG